MQNRRIVAIFLADHDRARQLADELTGDNVEPMLSQNAEEFHRAVNFQRIDLVAIDNELPGFLTGLEILERLNSDMLRPPAILVGKLSPELKTRAAALGIDLVLPPEVDVATLKTSISKVLEAETRTSVVIPPKARKLVLQSDVIKPLPQVLVKLAGYLDDPQASIVELAKDISVDPKITAELLKITNSTSFGLRNKVTKAADAVKFLGIRRTVSLVITASVIQSQAGVLEALPDPLRKWYQQRSVLIASTASAFARLLEDVSPDTAHILGLLQDLGILVMAHGFGPLYQQMVQRVRDVGQLRLEVAEKQHFEITHADVSAALLSKWALPPSLIAMVANHHESEAPADCSKTEDRFIHVMRIGEAVANLSDKFFPHRYQCLTALMSSYGTAGVDRCKDALAAGVAKTVEASQVFSIPAPDEAGLNALLEKIQAANNGLPPEGFDAEAAPAPAESTDAAPSAAAGPAASPESPAPVAPAEPRAAGKVLVIEDDAATLELIAGIIHSVGLEVLACSNGSRARELAPEAAVVLCDFHLGQERGADVLRDLRHNQFTGPMIVVSDDRTRSTITTCIQAGMNDFVHKPIDPTILLGKLSKHLGMLLSPGPVENAG